MKKILTHEEHVLLAKEISNFRDILRNIEANHSKNHKINKITRKIEFLIVDLRSILDDEYHSVTSDKEFLVAGNVYYK